MAQRTIVELIDDVDGSRAEETVTFALDGVSYEIDLSSEHAQELRAGLQAWIGSARKSGRSTASRGHGGGKSTKRTDLEDVRAWARSQGFEVSDRGRVAARILEAYDARG